MPPVSNAQFRLYLKASTNMKLTSEAAVNRVLYEGITNWVSLADFDESSMKAMAKNCKETIAAVTADIAAGIPTDEPQVPGTIVSTQSIVRLVVACNAVKYYISIGRVPDLAHMGYTNTLSSFKIEYEAYEKLQKQTAPEVPDVKDSDNDKKIIKWVPILLDCMSRTFGIKGPLSYVLRENEAVPSEVDDPILGNDYFGSSGSLQTELIARLSHGDSLYRSDNKTVYLAIEKACRGTSVASTVSGFSRAQNGRGAYLALIDHHAGDSKYRAIMKKRMNLLQNIKWNGRNYTLEKHVSNHRQAVEDPSDCASHITVSIPDDSQKVEYLIDSIVCHDSTLQASIGLIRSDVNNMRTDFERAASTLIEVDPYKRGSRPGAKTTANVSAIDFSSGRGSSGVDLRWHTPKEFMALEPEQRDELVTWQKTPEGKTTLSKSREKHGKRKGNPKDKGGKDDPKKRKQWLNKFVKSPTGLKHVMSVLAKEEIPNAAFIASLQAAQSATPIQAAGTTPNPVAPLAPTATINSITARFPASATKVTLNSILKKSNN